MPARIAALFGLVAMFLSPLPARADITADLILSLEYWHAQRLKTTRPLNARLVADAEARRKFRFHLDLDKEQSMGLEFYEAYGEWENGPQSLRLGRFQIPFGIYNRSELYYVGLIYDPLIRYYPYAGPHLEDSANGLEYVRSLGPWQVEATLTGRGEAVGDVVPEGTQGSLRVQRFTGRWILGLSADRSRLPDVYHGDRSEAHFLGVDFRYSRPALILRGELVAGSVPRGEPRGFYVDILFHPVALPRITFVGRTEAVRGQPQNGGLSARETLGIKWEPLRGTIVALNQLFEPARVRSGFQGTTLFVWYTVRL